MATNTANVVCDSSTYANYFSWASLISASFAQFGWAQSADTGQIMWSGMSISAVSGITGSSATYTYSSLTGLALAVGRTLTITGMTHSINNGTFVITALGSGTFTITNQNGTPLAETGSSGVVTAASSVPGSGAYFYEIWTPNDSLTNFYLRIEYGNISGTNCPTVALAVGTATNGAGTLTGTTIGLFETNFASFTAPSTTATYPCYLSGDLGRFGAFLWSTGINNSSQFFMIERSVNSSGSYTGSHVTIMGAGNTNSFNNMPYFQQTLHFTYGASPVQSIQSSSLYPGGMSCRVFSIGSITATGVLNGSVPFDTVAPTVGFFDYPLTTLGALAYAASGAVGSTFTTTLYGATRTFLTMGGNYIARSMVTGSSSNVISPCMRYD